MNALRSFLLRQKCTNLKLQIYKIHLPVIVCQYSVNIDVVWKIKEKKERERHVKQMKNCEECQ